MTVNKDEQLLPPKPGEIKKPVQEEDVPIIVYINGQPVQMTKIEALGVVVQITQIMLYLETSPKEDKKK
jgi:hypothetical protein